MAIDSVVLQNWLIGHATATAEIATPVLAYEPKSKIDYSAAGGKPVAAGWLGPLRHAPGHGGLDSTSARVTWTLRLHLNAFTPDQASVERTMLTAVDALFRAYFGDLRPATGIEFDPKGIYGEAITGDPGFLDIDKQLSRVYVITLGVVVADLWGEAE